MRILHLSSNRREQNLTHLFSVKTPVRKLTHKTKFEHFHMQKDANFRNTIIIHNFGLENPQNPNFLHHDSNALINLIQHQPTNHFLGTPGNTFSELCRPIVIYWASSTLAQYGQCLSLETRDLVCLWLILPLP